MPMEKKQALVEGTIIEMGLQDCANSVIGNWHLRGISGGEKRRVSIALEILMRPRLLFLDDHTSGLDSASAPRLGCPSRCSPTTDVSLRASDPAQQSLPSLQHQTRRPPPGAPQRRRAVQPSRRVM